MFIVLSFAWGLAVFHLVQTSIYVWNEKTLDPAILQRKKNLLGVFVIGSLYMVATIISPICILRTKPASSISSCAMAVSIRHCSGGAMCYSAICCRLLLIFFPGLGKTKCVMLASLLVIIGAFALLYVFIIGGQAYPLKHLPGLCGCQHFWRRADRYISALDI